MRKWLESYKGFVPSYGLDALYGCEYWKTLFQGCIPQEHLDARFRVPRSHAFLLYGPAGNGKSTLAHAFAKELSDVGYSFIHVPGMVLAETPGGIEELFEEILSEADTQDARGVCLLLEWLEVLAGQEEAMWVLNQYICTLKEREIPCIILVIVEEFSDVHPFLEKVMIPCQIRLPDKRERKICIEQMFGDEILLAPGLKYKDMAEMTEGFSYGRLCDLLRVVRIFLKQKARRFSGGDGKRLEEMLRQGYVILTEEMFADIVNQLKPRPAVVENVPVPDVSAMVSAVSVAQNPQPVMDNMADVMTGFMKEEKDFISSMMDLDLNDL